MKVIINEEIDSVDELHKLLKTKLDFPDYYGKNLDSLWDCISELDQIELFWESFDRFLNDYPDDALKFKKVFDDADKEFDFFSIYYE